MAKTESIYKVEFGFPPLDEDERTEFYFTSLSAIYQVFTEEQIGVKLSRLYNVGVSNGYIYTNKKVTVRKEPLTRKAQKKPYDGGKISK